MRYGRNSVAVAAVAVMAAVTVAGCGGGGGSKKAEDKPTDSAPSKAAASAGSAGATPSGSPTTVLAQMKGEHDMVVTITSAERDSGGFVTVEGTVDNEGSSSFDATYWNGPEVALQKSGASVAGAVLVDEAGKKRYYVLRDTDGRCLCTMGLVGIQPKESRPFFAQFPAPPAATTQVEFDLPTMPPAKITLSDGEG
ncbi:hypothetical protein [Actinacidiphila acidipaludis]|uniref:Secreted protein n=1 Tax=Actinacidiphila acidipaludis TaxID=2873382 RepID=A0ABS7Q2C9_9ACTN|nr:hypothetical protein [Streptomyces acidipaludis]MBY8877128.1 hypothetical protein [Streptomyces acidipaludis]